MLRVHCAVLKTREPLYPPTATGRIRTEHLHRVTAVTARGKRPVPFRTRKLSLSAPMVLHPPGCGRVGRRRNTIPNRGSSREIVDGPLFGVSLPSAPKDQRPAMRFAFAGRAAG